jgi:integrase
MLSVKEACIRSNGIHVTPRKTASSTGRSTIYEWTSDLRLAIQAITRTRRHVKSPYLFCTRRGLPYIKEDGTTSGFDSIWQRTMKKALNSTNLVDRFTEHDLRAKVASDTSADHAKELMGHSDSKITDRVYRRKTEVIQPAR